MQDIITDTIRDEVGAALVEGVPVDVKAVIHRIRSLEASINEHECERLILAEVKAAQGTASWADKKVADADCR